MLQKNLKSLSKKRYAKITLAKRKALVQFVINEKCSLIQTAKKLRIKLSTAKVIVNKFKKTGEFFHKKGYSDQNNNTDSLDIKQQQKQNLNILQKEEQYQLMPQYQSENYNFHIGVPFNRFYYYVSEIGGIIVYLI